MPNNPESFLINSVLTNRDMKDALGTGIKEDQFGEHREEWSFLQDYYKSYKKIPTKLIFKQRFPDFRQTQNINDTEHLCAEVLKAHIRRRLIATTRDVSHLISDGQIDKAVQTMHREIVTISADTGLNQAIDIISDFDEMYNEARIKQERVRTQGSAGVPTGFKTLDNRTGGPQPAEFWVVGARLGGAKSWTLIKFAANALVAGKKVQYNTMEMSRSQVGMRMHALLSTTVGQQVFSNIDLQQGKDFDLREYREFLKKLRSDIKGSFFVTDGSRGRTSTLTIASQMEQNNPDLVLVDYLTLLEGANGDWKNIINVSGDLKSNAQRYQTPIVSAAQLNRAQGIGKGPAGPEALAQGDSIGQDADAVITIHRMSESALEFKMVKYRHGTGNFKWFADFRPGEGMFEECSFDDAQALKDNDKDIEDAETVKTNFANMEQQQRKVAKRQILRAKTEGAA